MRPRSASRSAKSRDVARVGWRVKMSQSSESRCARASVVHLVLVGAILWFRSRAKGVSRSASDHSDVDVADDLERSISGRTKGSQVVGWEFVTAVLGLGSVIATGISYNAAWNMYGHLPGQDIVRMFPFALFVSSCVVAYLGMVVLLLPVMVLAITVIRKADVGLLSLRGGAVAAAAFLLSYLFAMGGTPIFASAAGVVPRCRGFVPRSGRSVVETESQPRSLRACCDSGSGWGGVGIRGGYGCGPR